MSAKGPQAFPRMYRLKHRLRERVRSYGLRPESKAHLCITMSALRHIPGSLPLGQKAVLILPNGRRSGLVREGAASLPENVSPETSSSRTSSLLRPPARIKSGLVHNDERSASHSGAFCVLFKATINKIRNIGVQPRAMHTAMACGQQSAVFKGSSLQIAHPVIPLRRLEAAWVWITFRPHKNTWPDNGLHDFMDFPTLPWRFTAPT
ncbi:hypothetical protein N026_18205 [Pseudomonas syringae UB303]|uniref:Uncharacterized protein n=2 Tax=Pseudomonas TaxID=286 RepID=A0AAJ4B9F3_PSESX|nr:hypothetical protein N026_18205 [Pseudomonas syringae UB303]